MVTISEYEYFEKFMKISHDLTYAETRMLYLLITEPYLFDLPQQIIANRLQTHRRTINIGLKRLKELKYIDDSLPTEEIGENKRTYKENSLTKRNRETAIKAIIYSFEDYYKIQKKEFIINEDFYCYVLSDIRLGNFSQDKLLITDTIKKKYPDVRFYFDLKKSSYDNENTYYIIRLINSEIIRFRDKRIYHLDITDLFQKIYEGFLIEKEEAQKIIDSQFPRIRITNKYLSLRQPYRGK